MKSKVEVDVEEVLDNLSYRDRSEVLSKYIGEINDSDVLIEELESRGYKVEEK